MFAGETSEKEATRKGEGMKKRKKGRKGRKRGRRDNMPTQQKKI